MINQVLEGQKDLTEHEKIDISLNDIAKGIKAQLKKEYPLSKFSLRSQFYSGGCSLHISIMETDFKIILPFEEITEGALIGLENRRYTREDIRKIQEGTHHQLSQFIDNEYKKGIWNNGVFLTQEGYNLVKRIIELTNKFNWDNSDTQTDYFDVKFYLHLSIGKWDKPYNEVLK